MRGKVEETCIHADILHIRTFHGAILPNRKLCGKVPASAGNYRGSLYFAQNLVYYHHVIHGARETPVQQSDTAMPQ